MPISRGQMPRQLYGLGSLVKKIGRAAKKVVKSDVGKAAITAAAMYKLGGGDFGALFKKGTPTGFEFGNILPNIGGGISDLGTAVGDFAASDVGKYTAIVAPSVIGGLLTARQKQDIEGFRETGDVEGLKNYLRMYYRNANPDADQLEIENFVRSNLARGGTPEENAIQASGIEGLPLNENPAGVTELDLRKTGGFIPPVGVKEKADDIPAMLSNNEFVFTADAVRGMGDGDVNKGAQRMYTMMKKLENGGTV